MNGIVRLKHIAAYQKVNYYSVVLGQDDEPIENAQSLFEEYLASQTEKNKDKLDHIISWLAAIGEQYGALEHLFRNESSSGEALGLPPSNFNSEPVFTENDEVIPNNLRLYCHRLNNKVVILFGGAVKMAKTAQKCQSVKPHFRIANQLTTIIDKAFQEKEIIWMDDDSNIEFKDDLVLYY